MNILDVTRGSYKEVIVGSTPYVKVEGFDLPNTGWLLTDFKIHMAEKNAIVQCFNEVNHIYAFGHDPDGSNFSVTYLVFLGKQCMKNGFQAEQVFKKFMDSYYKDRVSQKKAVIKVSYQGGRAIRAIVLDFDVSVYDEEMHIISVTVSGKNV